MRNTIMTEKIARRGVRVPAEYAADYPDQVVVRDACTRAVVTLRTTQTLAEVRRRFNEGLPNLRGLITSHGRRSAPRRPAAARTGRP
jgi:hypothetical protein